MSTREAGFAQALLDPGVPIPDGVTDPKGRPDAKRFNVYRNNVVVGLCDALEQSFPVIRQLVGDEFFRETSRVFVREHPPTSPLLWRYGAEFPDFLRNFPPARDLPYLGDVAHLEQCLRESYHAADEQPIAPEVLADIGPDLLVSCRFRLAASAILIESAWPIWSIWQVNRGAEMKVTMRAEEVLVARKDYDPLPLLLPTGGAALIAALAAGYNLGDALGTLNQAVDLAAVMTILMTSGVLVGVGP